MLTEDGVDGVHGNLVLGGVTDETLGVREGNIRRRRSVTLVVGDDLNTVVLPHSDARVCGSEIDSDSGPLSFASHYCSRSDRKSKTTNQRKKLKVIEREKM